MENITINGYACIHCDPGVIKDYFGMMHEKTSYHFIRHTRFFMYGVVFAYEMIYFFVSSSTVLITPHACLSPASPAFTVSSSGPGSPSA